MRPKTLAMLVGGLLIVAAAVPLVAAGSIPAHRPATAKQKPAIKTEEVGYFGNATIAHEVSVFVYSNAGPSAGNHVTVCLGGKCEAAHGHDAKLAWYSASFKTAPLAMGAPVRFTAIARNATGQTRVTVTKGLLCMHNSGSTPQT
jgi:hypothetical protein